MQPEQEIKEVKPNVQETVPVNQEVPSEETAPKSGKDWERFREARAQERKQKQKAEAEAIALRAALDSVLNKPGQQQPQQDYYGNAGEDEEARIEKKVQEAIARKEAEYSRKRQEEEVQEAPQRLVKNHPDYNQVCTAENVDYLEYHYPEVAEGFKYMPEGYNKWSAIYKAVKKLVPQTNNDEFSRKVDRNLNKPQSVSSPTVSTPSTGSLPVVLDEARKQENWKRMQKTLNSIG